MPFLALPSLPCLPHCSLGSHCSSDNHLFLFIQEPPYTASSFISVISLLPPELTSACISPFSLTTLANKRLFLILPTSCYFCSPVSQIPVKFIDPAYPLMVTFRCFNVIFFIFCHISKFPSIHLANIKQKDGENKKLSLILFSFLLLSYNFFFGHF